MRLKFFLVFVCALVFAGITANAEPREGAKALAVRTFTFKYKDADKAAAVIKSLMSADGTISIQPAANSLTVTDHAENLKAISKALTEYDAAAQPFRLSIRIVSAAREAAARVPEDLKDVAQKVALLHFNSFAREGDANVQGKEGDNGIVDMPTGYRAEFKFGEFDPASDSIKINDLHVSRVGKDNQLTSLVTTSLNLRIGQTYILGAAKSPQSARALMIVLVARR